MTCPRCSGSGVVADRSTHHARDLDGRALERDCPVCDGTGEA